MDNVSDHDLLIRIDERTLRILVHLAEINGNVAKHGDELYKDNGVCNRLTAAESKQAHSTTLIRALWAVVAAVAAAIFGLFMDLIRRG